MDMEEQEKRKEWLHIRLTAREAKIIDDNFKDTTLTRKSDYARSVLLSKPLIGSFRNRSMDDTMAELLRLRKELNNIGNNFNQAVLKLHMVDSIPELHGWLSAYDGSRIAVAKKIDEIRGFIAKIGDTW